MKITLPWPPQALSPNSRPHWAKKAKAVKIYRYLCKAMARSHGVNAPVSGPILFDVWFHPPSKRRYDRDNCVASFKSGADGLADAMGVDDVRFAPRYFMGEPVKDGAVVVEIQEGPWG